MSSSVRSERRFDAWLAAKLELDRYAAKVLGERGWSLLQSYGRLMSGALSGHYVSALDMAAATELVQALERGDELEVHLMHRHQSGNCESSSLRLEGGALLMRFKDREERA